MKHTTNRIYLLLILVITSTSTFAQDHQWVEGFDSVLFHYNGNRMQAVRDFRGTASGYMTGAWWSDSQRNNNTLKWRTAVVTEKKSTTFAFVGSMSTLPSDITRGPLIKLSVNGKYALTFSIGMLRDFTWQEGGYELKYISKRVEYPYAYDWRQIRLNGNSGIYQLTVPAADIEAGKPVTLQAELQPFERWHNGWFMVKARRDVLKETMTTLSGEIEALRQDMALANQQMHILATQVYSKTLGTDKFEHHVAYTNGYRHLHPADIIKLKNGDILMMTREATEHFARDGEVVMIRSKDGGKTWGQRQVISKIKDLDEREGCGIQLKDGTIIVGVFYNNLYNTDGTYDWDRRIQRTNDPARRSLGAHMITSKDNGYTWSEANFIDTRGMPFNNIEGPTDAPIEMPDGSILMGVIAYALNGEGKTPASVMIKSTDKGKTWKYLSTIANDPDGTLGGFMEPGIMRTKSGRIIAGLRNHAPDQAIWMTYSDDDGKTWVPVWKTEMIGHPVDLIQLADGRIMASYGIRPGIHTTPGGVRVCFSNDNGKTWDINTEVQLRNDWMNVDIGYPESLEMPDGRIMTAYYYSLFGRYFLGTTFWRPEKAVK